MSNIHAQRQSGAGARKDKQTCAFSRIAPLQGLSNFNPVASAWAGVGANEMEHHSYSNSMPMVLASASPSSFQKHLSGIDQASHCKHDSHCHCGSGCCSSGSCATCGHCATAALFDAIQVIALQAPVLTPSFVPCPLEKGEFTPPFRPPLQTS